MTWLLVALAAFYGWRYSKTSADPDWSYFNMRAFTGSLYGRDFQDCKTPGIHIWYWLLAKLVGKSVSRVKFANHFLISMVGVPLYVSLGLWPAIAYIVLVNSGWLLAFHGNVGQVPAALIALGMAYPVSAPAAWLLAVAFEPKLLLPFLVVAWLGHWGWVLVLPVVAIAAYLLLRNRQWFKWLWESSITIPARMSTNRTWEYGLVPWFTANWLLYVLPWALAGAYYRPDPLYWLPPVAYILFLVWGRVIRQNHLIPIIPWLAFSAPVPVLIGLCIVDWVSSGLYFGDIWRRWYSALADMNAEAKVIGEWLRERPGNIYVNGIHSGVYVHARKPAVYGMTEQIEIREVIPERRKEMLSKWRANPPEWVVCSDFPGINFKPIGYYMVFSSGQSSIYKRGQ